MSHDALLAWWNIGKHDSPFSVLQDDVENPESPKKKNEKPKIETQKRPPLQKWKPPPTYDFPALHREYHEECVDQCFMYLKRLYPALPYEKKFNKKNEAEINTDELFQDFHDDTRGFSKFRRQFAYAISKLEPGPQDSDEENNKKIWRHFLCHLLKCIRKRIEFLKVGRDDFIIRFNDMKSIEGAILNSYYGLMAYIVIYKDCSRAKTLWEAQKEYKKDYSMEYYYDTIEKRTRRKWVAKNPDLLQYKLHVQYFVNIMQCITGNVLDTCVHNFKDTIVRDRQWYDQRGRLYDTPYNREYVYESFLNELENDTRIIDIKNIIMQQKGTTC